MLVESIMTTKVVTVEMDDTLQKIREIFDSQLFHHLLVVEKYELVGIISDRDLLKHISPFANTNSETERDVGTLKKRVHQIMTRNPVTVTKETTVEDATRLLLEKGFQCLPVMNATKSVDGIVTWRDLLRTYIQA